MQETHRRRVPQTESPKLDSDGESAYTTEFLDGPGRRTEGRGFEERETRMARTRVKAGINESEGGH